MHIFSPIILQATLPVKYKYNEYLSANFFTVVPRRQVWNIFLQWVPIPYFLFPYTLYYTNSGVIQNQLQHSIFHVDVPYFQISLFLNQVNCTE